MTGMNDLIDKRIKERQEKCLHTYRLIRNRTGIFCSMCAKRLDE